MPLAGGAAWFKACRPVQAFEPRLSAELSRRWPGRVADVLAWDEPRAWLLTRDAGTAIGDLGNPPELWLQVLPGYAELQRGEIEHAPDHLRHGVPDLRTAVLPERYEDLLGADLPIPDRDMTAFRALAPRFAELCAELEAGPVHESVQHDDLHVNGVFVAGGELRVLDWGDASIGHPFFSLVVTFEFLRDTNGLDPADPWFARLRDAYLEPWGRGLVPLFDLAFRVGTVAHCFTWLRHRAAMPPPARAGFDAAFPKVLDLALAGLRAG